MTCPRS